MNTADIIPAAGIVIAAIVTYLYVRYVPATEAERQAWAEQRQARAEASTARTLAFEAARAAAKENAK